MGKSRQIFHSFLVFVVLSIVSTTFITLRFYGLYTVCDNLAIRPQTDENGAQGVLAPGHQEKLYAFQIRDSRRLSSTYPPDGMHIFDYVDVNDVMGQREQKLYIDGHSAGNVGCQEYSKSCYKTKMLDVFVKALNITRAQFLFYMEADNTLCISLTRLENMAVFHNRYFIGTGIGASGWIMSRSFVDDFIRMYSSREYDGNFCPDCVAAKMMTEKKKQRHMKWSVTRQYLVSHSFGVQQDTRSLSGHGTEEKLKKHLPRCLEPHRGKWGDGNIDAYGWDYFDYEICPDADIFPCQALVLPGRAYNVFGHNTT